jgi:hypothetical protein
MLLVICTCAFFGKGPEICNDLNSVGMKLDYWVTGYGKEGLYYMKSFCQN